MILYGKAITLDRRGERETFISQLTQLPQINPNLWNKTPTVLQDIYHTTLGGILSRRRVLSFNKNDNFPLQATDIDAHSSACLLKGLFFPSSSQISMNALCNQAHVIPMLIAPTPMALTAVHVKKGSLEVASFAKVRSVRYSKFTLNLKKVTFHTLGNGVHFLMQLSNLWQNNV